MLDQLELRGAAAEQVGEKALEVAVDHLERAEQPFARFAIETLNPLAQPLDRLDEIVTLRSQRRMLGLDFAQFLLGTQIDGAESLAVALEFFEFGLDGGDIGQSRLGIETGEAGKRFGLGFQNLPGLGGGIDEAAT